MSSLSKEILHITTVPMTLRFLRGQVGFMKRQGYEIKIVSSPGEELDQFGEQEEVSVHAVPMQRRIAPLRDLRSLLELWKTIRTIQPSIVHSHTPKGGLLGMCAATAARVPVRCYHLRGLPMMGATGPKREILRWAEKLSCALADEVFCVSHSLRDVAISESLCAPHKIQVLAGGSGNGVDSDRQYNPATWATSRKSIRARLSIPDDALLVGFVGRMVLDKGILELHQAWQRVRESHPKVFLLLIGPRENADGVPDNIIEDFDNDPKVRRLDMVPNVAPYYAAMDVLALPTYREGFPNVLLEAAAMKLPVVATRVPGCVDAVLEGETGALIASHDSEALASALLEYLGSEELRKSHGTKAQKRVLTQFSQTKIWDALESRYQALLASYESRDGNPASIGKKQHS